MTVHSKLSEGHVWVGSPRHPQKPLGDAVMNPVNPRRPVSHYCINFVQRLRSPSFGCTSHSNWAQSWYLDLLLPHVHYLQFIQFTVVFKSNWGWKLIIMTIIIIIIIKTIIWCGCALEHAKLNIKHDTKHVNGSYSPSSMYTNEGWNQFLKFNHT